MKLKEMRITQPERVEHLERMLENNVLYWHRSGWDEMLQLEILDRNLVVRGSEDHNLLLELLEERKSR